MSHLETSASRERIYLDHAAATPLMKEAFEAMVPHLSTLFGNASAVHLEGIAAREALHAARSRIATTLMVKPPQVTFTGSGTESNNLAILGYITALQEKGLAYTDMEIVTTPIEHPSVTETLRKVAGFGVTILEVPVGEDGIVRVGALIPLISKKTVLVTFAYANSEVGVVQPVHRLVRAVKESAPEALVHLDAAQAPLWLPCAPLALGVDMVSFDAGKCGGPKGVGILVCRAGVTIAPLLGGGGQEAGLRPGTEAVASIVGASVAFQAAQQTHVARSEAVRTVRDAALLLLPTLLPEAIVNGSLTDRLPNNINISLPGFNTEYAVVYLDAHGVAASTRSACAGKGAGESHVVFALTGDHERARTTLRFTLGHSTTLEDLRYTFTILQQFCAKHRGLTK